MRTSNKLLTVRVKLVLLVVNSVKLHLSAFNDMQETQLEAFMIQCFKPNIFIDSSPSRLSFSNGGIALLVTLPTQVMATTSDISLEKPGIRVCRLTKYSQTSANAPVNRHSHKQTPLTSRLFSGPEGVRLW